MILQYYDNSIMDNGDEKITIIMVFYIDNIHDCFSNHVHNFDYIDYRDNNLCYIVLITMITRDVYVQE